jgi:hypothetical protein
MAALSGEETAGMMAAATVAGLGHAMVPKMVEMLGGRS